ncbi:PREDICTED: kita-kyushu lung cancer antigen 1 [Hipposideros armiger]|uniref:Kita-kyushu lung cancer antigen 1 n=1 Tax=Hipposideros armiger TaxID=186990 RepID=A0A8B7QKV5_HIPAR|nr:PREDICTED: kita-kyushu lung cancer antigen 1 [Hipposideros armiger]
MSILFLLVGGLLFACMVVWKKRFQRNIGEMSSNSSSLALVRPSSFTWSTKSNTNASLTVNSLSQDVFINLPHSIAMQKKILVNLSIVEYKLAELEHILIIKAVKDALVNRKSIGMLRECTDIRGKH